MNQQPRFSRRAILTTGGASIVLVGLSGCSVVRTDLEKARQPWREAGESFGDPRLDALAYAVLAPNPHNRQPWLVALDGDNGLTLYCDLNRLLPATDPPNRQIVIGLGCFLELLRQAGADAGYDVAIDPFPDGEPFPVLDERPVARVTFNVGATIERDPLFGAALDRRTSRLNFDSKKPVDDKALQSIGSVLKAGQGEFVWTTDAGQIADLKDICSRAWHIEVNNPAAHGETVALTRIGQKAVNENPDGISLYGPLIETLRIAGVFTPEKMNTFGSRAPDETEKFYDDLIQSSMAFGWLNTAANSRLDQLSAGAGWMRLHLASTKSGLSMQPLSQALQEYPEMAAPFREIHEFAGVEPPARVQGLFRFGYAKAPPPAPRWPMKSRIIEA